MATGITLSRPSGIFAGQQAPAQEAERPQAMLWGNLGYPVTFKNPTTGEMEERFISIPVGVPVDTQKPINITTRSPIMAEMQAAQNQLLADLQAAGAEMEPGAEQVVHGLEFRLRRVNDKVEAPTITEASPFARKVSLFSQAEAPVAEVPADKAKG